MLLVVVSFSPALAAAKLSSLSLSLSLSLSSKVSSTETGHVFGSIVYDSVSAGERVVINMNDIHIDIMDYIAPATCSGTEFRSMWAEFEWENKVRAICCVHISLSLSLFPPSSFSAK